MLTMLQINEATKQHQGQDGLSKKKEKETGSKRRENGECEYLGVRSWAEQLAREGGE